MSRLASGSFALALLLAVGCNRVAAPRPAKVDVGAAIQAVVADFRGVIVLLADEPAPEDRATLVAWLLFHDSQERLAALRDAAAADESARSAFLDRLESDPGLRDAIAYANLGDALAQLSRADEAKQAYQTFLQMSPKAVAAPSVEKKLAAMP